MTNDIAMSTPVTRGELREELAQFENRIERKFDGKLEQLEHRFDGKLEQLEHRFDGKLELWGGALLARIAATEQRVELWGGALLARIAESEQRVELWGGALLARIAESEQRLLGELARHTQAVYESMTKQISVVDEKYNDLPGRTARLEADVHALKQR